MFSITSTLQLFLLTQIASFTLGNVNRLAAVSHKTRRQASIETSLKCYSSELSGPVQCSQGDLCGTWLVDQSQPMSGCVNSNMCTSASAYVECIVDMTGIGEMCCCNTENCNEHGNSYLMDNDDTDVAIVLPEQRTAFVRQAGTDSGTDNSPDETTQTVELNAAMESPASAEPQPQEPMPADDGSDSASASDATTNSELSSNEAVLVVIPIEDPIDDDDDDDVDDDGHHHHQLPDAEEVMDNINGTEADLEDIPIIIPIPIPIEDIEVDFPDTTDMTAEPTAEQEQQREPEAATEAIVDSEPEAATEATVESEPEEVNPDDSMSTPEEQVVESSSSSPMADPMPSSESEPEPTGTEEAQPMDDQSDSPVVPDTTDSVDGNDVMDNSVVTTMMSDSEQPTVSMVDEGEGSMAKSSRHEGETSSSANSDRKSLISICVMFFVAIVLNNAHC